MTRYRLRPCAWEEDGDGYRVGALPHGPITRIDGPGLLVLSLFEEPGRTLDTEELAREIREIAVDVPANIHNDLSMYLITLTGLGILQVVQ